MELFRRLLSKLAIRRIRPIQVQASDSVERVVIETVRMYVGDDVRVSAGLSFADTSIFDPDDPSDIVESLERSFRVKPPRTAYERVQNVSDLIQVFQTHVESSKQLTGLH